MRCFAPTIGGLLLTVALAPLAWSRPAADAQEPLTLPAQQTIGPAWSANAPLYQLNPHNFTPEGTFNAAAQHLPRLQALGVRVLWLMPIHPVGKAMPSAATLAEYKGAPLPLADLVPTRTNPFAPTDHTAVAPELGTEDDFRRFVEQADRLGMRVMLGWVPNHSSWDAPLLRDHPGFYFRGDRGQVLYHHPWKTLARLDYRGGPDTGLYRYMLDARQKFVDLGVAGFREDVAHHTPLRYWNWQRPRLDADRELLMLAEAHHFELLGPFDAVYDWKINALYWSVIAGASPATRIDDHLRTLAENTPPGSRFMRFNYNHDQTGGHSRYHQARDEIEAVWGVPHTDPIVPKHTEKYGPAFNACFVLNTLLPNSQPMVFMGMEVGHHGRYPHHRAGVRIPWDRPPDTQATAFFQTVLRVYRDHPAVTRGTFRKLVTRYDERVYAFVREAGDDRVVVAVNLSSRPLTLDLDEHGRFREVFTEREADLRGSQKLGPWGYRVWVVVD